MAKIIREPNSSLLEIWAKKKFGPHIRVYVTQEICGLYCECGYEAHSNWSPTGATEVMEHLTRIAEHNHAETVARLLRRESVNDSSLDEQRRRAEMTSAWERASVDNSSEERVMMDAQLEAIKYVGDCIRALHDQLCTLTRVIQDDGLFVWSSPASPEKVDAHASRTTKTKT